MTPHGPAMGWRELHRLVWRERRAVLTALGCAVLGPVAAMVVPFAAKLVIDDVIGEGRRERLLPIAVGTALAVLVQAATAFGAAHAGALAGQRTVTRLRLRLQRHVLRLPMAFFDSTQTGMLISRFMTDCEQVRSLLGPAALQLVSGGLTATLALTVLCYLNWRLTAIVAVVLVVITLCLTRGFRRLYPLFRGVSDLQAALTGSLTDTFSGIRVVKAYAAERHEAHGFARGTHRVLRTALRASRTLAALIAAIALATGGMSLVLLVLGGKAVVTGAMSLGDLALFVFLVGLLGAPLVQVAAVGSEVGRALAALAGLREVLELPTETMRDRDRRPVPRLAGTVVCEGVGYGYVPDLLVLRGVSLYAPAGSMTALTGPNGAGKSTLLRLLMAFDDPTSGRILIDGQALVEFRRREYRRQLGVVLQSNHLFDGTIADNIRYGRPGSSLAEFRCAARLAQCDEFVERLPDGYQTVVGERGVKLSAGQGQRVAIARALLADPRILLLDEATSHLDSESEALIQDALGVLCKGRTTFVIAHRLTTIQRADQILVFQSGAIVERGRHDELLARRGRYWRLSATQAWVNEHTALEAATCAS